MMITSPISIGYHSDEGVHYGQWHRRGSQLASKWRYRSRWRDGIRKGVPFCDSAWCKRFLKFGCPAAWYSESLLHHSSSDCPIIQHKVKFVADTATCSLRILYNKASLLTRLHLFQGFELQFLQQHSHIGWLVVCVSNPACRSSLNSLQWVNVYSLIRCGSHTELAYSILDRTSDTYANSTQLNSTGHYGRRCWHILCPYLYL